VLWRRVETISPDAYALLVDWARASAAGLPLRWLEAMAINEVEIEPVPAVQELDALLDLPPPAAITEHLRLLRDLIWEACDPNSDWLQWRPCRICGRRWATVPLETVILCPVHATPPVLIELLSAEMTTYGSLVNHRATIERLRQLPPARQARPGPASHASTNGAHERTVEPDAVDPASISHSERE
jgi:hypothetical protein